MAASRLLEMDGITKTFPGVLALRAVDFDVLPGEVHAIVGHNGAGKSTLIKILTGAYSKDSGTIELGGHPVSFHTPAGAQAAGIATIYQETSLVPYLSAAENIFLGREPRQKWGAVTWNERRRDATRLLRGLGVRLDVQVPTMQLSIALQQMVMLARAVSIKARLVVMDEPTSSLDAAEVRILFDVIRQFQKDGVGIVYISHRLDEIFELSDRVTVLRDGVLVATLPTQSTNKLDLVARMLGRDLDEVRASGQTAFTEAQSAGATEPLLEVTGLTRGLAPNDVSLSIGKGEIVGLAGLLGSGRTEVARTIFGADRADRGTITMAGRRVRIRSPRDAVRAGMGFASEDRKTEGIVPHLSVRDNITLAALPVFARLGILSSRRQRSVADSLIKRMDIRTPSGSTPVRNLSGGNQQKVILARWLCRRPQLLLLDEPTRGIDVGAKAEIQRLIDELAREGLGILMISSELEEVLEGSDRVVVMQEGRAVGELTHGEATEERVLRLISQETTV
ncbi:MAG: sugar ABC transporter ATP-binding protein [Chloroflexota bacterium]